MNDPLTVIAHIRAKPGYEARLQQELQRLVAPTLAEQGCINYDLHQSRNDPASFALYENWKSEAHLDTHFKTPYLVAFMKMVPEIVEEPIEITKWTKLAR